MSFRITEQICACGCETKMPSTLVDRGWKYLRGHKPKQLAKPRRFRDSAPRPGPVTVIGEAQVRLYLEANHRNIAAQLEEASSYSDQLRMELDQALEKCRRLTHAKSRYDAALAALTEMAVSA